MREIKFRAWHNTQNVMLQVGDDYGTENPLDCVMYKLGGQDVVLMQYTGLKDKNGREIYEGDIVSTDLDRPFNIVIFRNGSFMFQCHDNGKDYFDLMLPPDDESDNWKFGEVIGNIYENPELLKGESA
jgi:uncharacterized phage protein (TIGR01671 family)